MRLLNILILIGTLAVLVLATLAARALAGAEIDRALPALHYVASYDRTLGLLAAALAGAFAVLYLIRRIDTDLGFKASFPFLTLLAAQATALWFDFRFALNDLPRRFLLPEEPAYALANGVTIATGAVSILSGLVLLILLFMARTLVSGDGHARR